MANRSKNIDTDTSTSTIACSKPYDWPAVLAFFRLRAVSGLERAGDAHYTRAVIVDGSPAALTVQHDPESACLSAALTGGPNADSKALRQRVQAMFDTDAKMRSINRTLNRDAALAPVQRIASRLRVAGSWDRFELVMRAVLGQQVTVAAGRTLCERLCTRYGRPLPATLAENSELAVAFPTPQALADADIVAIGMPSRRVQTLQTIAAAVADGSLDLYTANADELERALLDIPGIGPWTAGYVRMRASKDPDAFPPSDVALLNAARALGIATDHKSLLAAAERWRPWRAYAAVRLWRWLQAGTNRG
ncbi:MAG: AlkA N-terminal domain-containing protein [Pseudomonadota bacterium]